MVTARRNCVIPSERKEYELAKYAIEAAGETIDVTFVD